MPRPRTGICLVALWYAVALGHGAVPILEQAQQFEEYRLDFCYGRQFPPHPQCDLNTLPHFSRLQTTEAIKSKRILKSSSTPNRTRFAVLMQNGRVGSTWFVKLLNTLTKGIDCQGEEFDSNPCKDTPEYTANKKSRWADEGIVEYVDTTRALRICGYLANSRSQCFLHPPPADTRRN